MKKLSLILLALVIHVSTALAVDPTPTLPDVLNPVSVTLGTTTSISGGDVIAKIENYGTLSAYFGIYNYGTINSFTNYVGGSVLAVQGIVSEPGASIGGLSNAGTFTVDSWGLNNSGTVQTVTNTGSIISGYIGIHNNGPNTLITLLDNSGTISGGVANAAVNNGGTITTFTNTGVISGQMGVANTGVITTFNNSQGAYLENGSSYAENPLIYRNILPVNYNVIVNSPSSFGQIISQETEGENAATGDMLFDVADGSTVLDQTTYGKVLQGLVGTLDLSAKKITGEDFTVTYTGLYDGLDYYLESSGSPDMGNWNLVFGLLGPLAEDTQAAVQYQVQQLRGVFNMQAAAANFGLQADCGTFNADGMCVSLGSRYGAFSHPDASTVAGVVTLGLRLSPHIRIGAHLDQTISASDPSAVDIRNKTPLMGASAVWTQGGDGLGLQVRLANSYQVQDLRSTRAVFGTSEAGTGSPTLTAQGYLADITYAVQLRGQTVIRPHVGLRYAHVRQAGYTEAASDLVLDPLTVDSLVDESAVALAGVELQHAFTDDLEFSLYLGVEQDLYRNEASYAATDLNESALASVEFHDDIQATRPVASVGASYLLSAAQRISTSVSYQQMPTERAGSITGYVGYMVAF